MRALTAGLALYVLAAAMPVATQARAAGALTARCWVEVVTTAPLVAVGRCTGWRPGDVRDVELRIDGPGGRQHWSPLPGWGPRPHWDWRHWTGPAVTARHPGRYRVSLVIDGSETAETWVEIREEAGR